MEKSYTIVFCTTKCDQNVWNDTSIALMTCMYVEKTVKYCSNNDKRPKYIYIYICIYIENYIVKHKNNNPCWFYYSLMKLVYSDAVWS